ncbi:MAG: enoyl-CoA hydratase/isomerase family protein [Pseudomonadota bacterium]
MSCLLDIISKLNSIPEIVLLEKKIDSLTTYWVITLNRPQALNALNFPMVKALRAILHEFYALAYVSWLVIHGAGERSFCAGGDVKYIAQKIKEDYSNGRQLAQDFFTEEYELDYEISISPKPIIVWAHGLTLGGGVGLLQASPWSVVENKTQLAMPELKIGFFPDVGGSYYLPRLNNYLGIWLAFTGIHISAVEACAANWIQYLSDISWQKAEHKLSLNWNKDVSIENNLRLWLQNLTYPKNMPENLLSVEQQEWCEKLLNNQPIELFYNWIVKKPDPSLKTAQENILQSSPLSLKLTQYLLKQGQSLSLSQALDLEKKAAAFIIQDGDFIQGVGERLINKNRNPINWNIDFKSAELLINNWKKTL